MRNLNPFEGIDIHDFAEQNGETDDEQGYILQLQSITETKPSDNV